MDVVKISKGNTKMGRIWNISLPPVLTCRNDAPCARDCYAMKSWRMFENVRDCWTHNLTLWETDPGAFESSLLAALSLTSGPRFFRWHVAGDIPDAEYPQMVVRVAKALPEIKFLIFTKQYELINKAGFTQPANLAIIFSAWPGLTMDNPYNYPVAWMQDGAETRVPDSVIECPGYCDTCGMCWALPTIGKDIVFHKH